MAISNRDRVARVMDLLKEGLGPFVLREYKMVYHKDYGREIFEVLRTDRYDPPAEMFADEQTLLAQVDVQGWLNLLWRRWNDVFQEKLGHTGRSYVSELITARNDWAHQSAFSNEEAYRVADTATLLLRAISAATFAEGTHEIAQDLLRLRYDAEAKKARKSTPAVDEIPTTTQAGLRPWRQAVAPHPDVASGRYLQAEFAADLAQVVDGKADVEYQDPIEFFRRTYLTEGLLDMLVTGVLRLCGEGGDPVVQLQTSFGGGKTHSMLALYHLAGSGIQNFADIPGGERIAELINADPPEANRAVLVGTALDPTAPRSYADGITTRTLWGELAYQLGGPKGYAMVETADQRGASPGGNTLLDLLEEFGPCLIIIDELVAYARNLYRVEGLPGGSFDAVMTFIQALTEATRRSSDSMLLVSIPASDIEIGGAGGREALEVLSNVIGRIESVWKPVTATESFEIVRRRLFASEIDYPARDAVVNAFADMYRQNAGDFPSGVGEGEYRERMRSAYPIHPELFDRLYQDWSTLERFQRTRGVLRLMAAVIHDLWTRNDQSLMIMPSTIPLDSAPVRNEMLRYLPENWPAVVDVDIDGVESRPFAIDQAVPMLGRYAACRRVARSIFVGSAPSVAAQAVRGVEEVRVRIATAQPGENIAVFGDALKRMSNQLTYLYTDGSRYWYDTRPTVNRLARDRAQNFTVDDVNRELITRLKKVGKTRDFAAAHVAPLDTSDVIDEAQARVVVLHPNDTYKKQTNGESPAIQMCQQLLEARGNAPRLYRNMLVFIAPDQGGTEALREATREYLAWQSIRNDEEQLNLDRQQSRQVRTQLDSANETVDVRLMEAYTWLIVPWQSEPLGSIEWESFRISGAESFYDRAARKLLKDGLLIPAWSPDNLRLEMERVNLWGENLHISLKQLWEYFGRYCYLPRLSDESVLLGAIKDGISRLDAPFAYATGIQDGKYLGLAFRSASSIYFDAQSLLVQPEAAQQQIDEERRPVPEPILPPKPRGNGGTPDPDSDPDPGPEPIATHYYGAVELDAQRINREMSVIVEEIIQRLTSLTGCDVEIHLEVRANRADGFDEATIRTINENSRTLKFDTHEFD